MKQIQYTIAFLFTLLCISSCEIDRGDDITNRRTQAGNYIFCVVEYKLQSYLQTVDMALKFDAYLQADEKEQARILKYLLPGYQVLEQDDTIYFEYTEDTWALKEHKWIIVRTSTDSLSSPSSAWSMGFSDSYNGTISDNIPLGGFKLTGNKQRNSWILDIEEYKENDLSEGSFEVKRLTDRKLHSERMVNDYSITTVQSTFALIEGQSTYYPDMPPTLSVKYQLTKPFYMKLLQDRNIFFVEGAAVMDVEQGESIIQKDQISAEIEQSNYDFVTIRYRGITEEHPRNKYGYGGY